MSEVPVSIDVKKGQGMTIRWGDGAENRYSLSLLRSMCPCAKCKEERAEKSAKKPLLNVLPGNYAGELTITSAELVGNYALKLVWSDGHDTGIYSFAYLRLLSE